ncbi:unnamed protein product [Aureobasidium uvarum]|uniref:White collar-2 n=1 Tax=Aureobasidium uvarum TaxID=2773716 RepID=A0A9N8KBA0_9PEZI|nr:unnamed protein product [Aureobasidium uvarum]
MSYLSSVDGSLPQNVSAQETESAACERPLIVGFVHQMAGVGSASDHLLDPSANLMSDLHDQINMLPMDLDLNDPNLDVSLSNVPFADPGAFGNNLSSMSFAQQSHHHHDDGQSQSNMSGIGAGPLPTGFGMGPPSNGGNTLTEFTKRRNWSQRVIEELRDFLHILTPDGRILYVSPSAKTLTGYEPRYLVGKFIGEFVHPEDSGIFMREFNESIASGNPLRFFYRFKREDGTYIIFECDGHPHISSDQGAYGHMSGSGQGAMSASGLCRGFFMMARPYPTKNAALLDSFLEHKIENERLKKRIEELKREEVEENQVQERQWQEQSRRDPSEPGRVDGSTENSKTPNYQGMPPPAKPPISNTALTRQNLDSALSAQQPDSIADKMSRYEGSNHLETIEMLTGLRYRDGERSHGISTGDTSPALIRGDAGIAILLDRDRDGTKEKKKKLKVAEEYVCADCGTLDSPEWRKGPKGPKTLCNACGLRWAKKEKKKAVGDSGTNSNAGMTPGGGVPSLLHKESTGSS